MVGDLTIYDVTFTTGLNEATFVDKRGTRGYVHCDKAGMIKVNSEGTSKWGGNACNIRQCSQHKTIPNAFECDQLDNIYAVFLNGKKLEELSGFEAFDNTQAKCTTHSPIASGCDKDVFIID